MKKFITYSIHSVHKVWKKQDLCEGYQTLVTCFTYHASVIKDYSTSFKDDFPHVIINFLGSMEYIEEIPLERADAGYSMCYTEYHEKESGRRGRELDRPGSVYTSGHVLEVFVWEWLLPE